jgi:hypothetical protein
MKSNEETDASVVVGPLTEDAETFAVLREHMSTIHGGYVRDLLMRVPPHDIDCVVHEDRLAEVMSGLRGLGYETNEDDDRPSLRRLRHATRRPVDVFVTSDPTLPYLGDMRPDVDVNGLYWGFDPESGEYRLASYCRSESESRETVGRLTGGVMKAVMYPGARDDYRLAVTQGRGFTLFETEEDMERGVPFDAQKKLLDDLAKIMRESGYETPKHE